MPFTSLERVSYDPGTGSRYEGEAPQLAIMTSPYELIRVGKEEIGGTLRMIMVVDGYIVGEATYKIDKP